MNCLGAKVTQRALSLQCSALLRCKLSAIVDNMKKRRLPKFTQKMKNKT